MSTNKDSWKSINKIMVEVAIPETTARRYLTRFKEFFVTKADPNKKGSRLYRDDTGAKLRKIASLYEEKYSTQQILTILKNERMSTNEAPQDSSSNRVHAVEAEVHVATDTILSTTSSSSVSIETISQQNMLIMATLNELAVGINKINTQQAEIAQLKREIQELRLQLVSLAQYGSGGSGDWKPSGASVFSKPSKPTKPAVNNMLEEYEETSEHIDEVVPNEPVNLPKSVDRQQLADIIAELRANEPPIKPKEDPVAPPQAAEMSQVSTADIADVVSIVSKPSTDSSSSQTISAEETSILLEMSYVPPANPSDTSNLSRVSSRNQTKSQDETKKWWQFWR